MNVANNNWNNDFFEEFPEYKLISIFKKLAMEDKNASQVMWGIYLLEHPKSPLYKIKDKEIRKSEIETNYFKVNWEDYEDIKNEFIKLNLTDNQKFYKTWVDKARALDVKLEKSSVDTESEVDWVLKLFKDAKKIWETLDEIKRRVDEDEASEYTIKGKGQLSAKDRKNS